MNSHGHIGARSLPLTGSGGTEAIILAGGLGTRLRSVVADIPKCMAPVAGKPFLQYVMEYLIGQGIQKFIFSLGYKHEMIRSWLKVQYPEQLIKISLEEEPLGTGGAILLACTQTTEKTVVVVNGDTMFTVDISKLEEFHENHNADCTLSLKPMTNFDRYGVVELREDLSVASFNEKQHYSSGLINGGVYVLNVPNFLKEGMPAKFSFEKDYLESYVNKRKFFGLVQDKYFIDIGVPEDYERAGRELK